MKTIILTLLITITTIATCNSQTIEMKKSMWGNKFSQDGKRLSISETMNIMKSNSKAFELMKKAKSNTTISSILGGVGGLFIGVPVGQSISGQKTNWILAGIGIGIAGIGLPISINATKQAEQSIELYNSSLTLSKHKPEYKYIMNGNGIGITMSF